VNIVRRYVLRKILGFFSTAFLISLVTFGALQVLPGDPATLILGTEASPEALISLRSQLGLDRPAIVRYGQWLVRFVQGDLGESIRYSIPVRELMGHAVPLTFTLAIMAVSAALLIAVPLGIVSATKQGTWFSKVIVVLSQLGMAMPQFWVGILFIEFFAVRIRIFPSGGYDGLLSLVLPALTLCMPRAAVLTRMVRAGMMSVLGQDYVRTARAKGLSERTVLYKHALANGAIGVFTIAGIQLTQLLAGTIVIEQVFGLPGLGQLLLAGVMQRDLPLVQGLVMLSGLLILFVNFVFDLILMLLDPRVRFE